MKLEVKSIELFSNGKRIATFPGCVTWKEDDMEETKENPETQWYKYDADVTPSDGDFVRCKVSPYGEWVYGEIVAVHNGGAVDVLPNGMPKASTVSLDSVEYHAEDRQEYDPTSLDAVSTVDQIVEFIEFEFDEDDVVKNASPDFKTGFSVAKALLAKAIEARFSA